MLKRGPSVLKSTDEQNMLARLKAHKDFVEHEKAAETKKLSDKFELEKKAMLAEATTTAEKIIDKYLQPLVSSVATFARNTLPYVPRSRRKEFIDGIKLPEDVQAPVKDFLYSVAANAPDLSAPTLADFAPSGTLSEAAKFADAVLTPPPLRTTPGDKYRV